MAFWNRTGQTLDPQLGVPTTALERRDPTAATRPVVHSTPGHPMVPQWDAHHSLTYGYYANIFVYRCVQVIAEALAGLPLRAGADPSKPTDYNIRSPLARLLGPPPDGPNPETTGSALLAWSCAQKLVTGRWAWELELDSRDRPTALWALPASYLKAMPAESGNRYFKGFEYGRVGEERRLKPEQVLYHWQPSQEDWRQPESVLQAARLDVSVAVMQDRYDYAFLKNDARPASVVVYEEFASDDDDEAFRRGYRGEYGGPDNAGKVLFVEAGPGGAATAMHVEQLGLSQRDTQAVQRYAEKLRAITVAFGVPLTVLGDASGRTFSNASEEYRVFWTGRMLSTLRDFTDAINLKLAPRLGSDVCWFDLSGVEALQPAPRFVPITVGEAFEKRIATKNEAREAVGLPPVDGGDDFEEKVVPPVPAFPLAVGQNAAQKKPFVRSDQTWTMTTLDDATAEFYAKPGGVDVTLGSNTVAGSVSDAPPARSRRTRTRATRALSPEDAEQRKAKIWKAADTQARALERYAARTMRALFARQERETLRRLEGKRGRQQSRTTDPDGLFDPRFWTAATAEHVEALYEAILTVGGARVAARFGFEFDIAAPYAQEFVRARANQLAGHVTETTYGQIRDAMAEGVNAGETIPELAKRIRHVFGVADEARAVTIARTETISAFNGSAAAVAAELPSDVAAGQEWISTRDGRTRDDHADADGQVVGIGVPFVVGGDAMAYPGDPSATAGNVINCRCTTAILTPAEMAERGAPRPEWRADRDRATHFITFVPVGPLDERACRKVLQEAA